MALLEKPLKLLGTARKDKKMYLETLCNRELIYEFYSKKNSISQNFTLENRVNS